MHLVVDVKQETLVNHPVKFMIFFFVYDLNVKI
jgi:hypothetical protein